LAPTDGAAPNVNAAPGKLKRWTAALDASARSVAPSAVEKERAEAEAAALAAVATGRSPDVLSLRGPKRTVTPALSGAGENGGVDVSSTSSVAALLVKEDFIRV